MGSRYPYSTALLCLVHLLLQQEAETRRRINEEGEEAVAMTWIHSAE